MAQAIQQEVPEKIDGDSVVEQVIREYLWRPAARQNDWRAFLIVGREGTGKSLTCARVLRCCDPTFGVDRTHFRPLNFWDDISRDYDVSGKGCMLDEAGVAFGNRTWHDREQVKANQTLQTARDDNRIIGLTLPRMGELDVQLKGRLHMVFKTVGMREGEWVKVKPYIVDPTRLGQKEEYEKHPKLEINGQLRKVESLKISPPDDEYIDRYELKKAEYKDELYTDQKDRHRDQKEEDELTDPKEIAGDIIDSGRVEEFISDNHGQQYIDRQLIELEYGVGRRVGKKTKKALEQEVEV